MTPPIRTNAKPMDYTRDLAILSLVVLQLPFWAAVI